MRSRVHSPSLLLRTSALALALTLAVLGFAAVDAHASNMALPVVIRGDGVVVRAEAGLGKLAAKVAKRSAATLAGIYEDLEGLPRPRNIEIRLVVRAADMSRAAPAGLGAPLWASGVAYPRHGIVVVATRSGPSSINVSSTVAHELAHMALGAAFGSHDPPRWLHEGFAYLHSSDWSFSRQRTLTGMAWSGSVIPLSELDRSFPAREQQTHRAYAQSYDFVVFLARRGRYKDRHDDGDKWAFRVFLREMAGGLDSWAAARRAYDANIDELYGEWYTALRERYLVLPAGLFALGIWVVGAILLVLGYRRRRKQNRARLAVWEREEQARDAMRDALGRDDLGHDDLDHDDRGHDDRGHDDRDVETA